MSKPQVSDGTTIKPMQDIPSLFMLPRKMRKNPFSRHFRRIAASDETASAALTTT
jgi:hypothetical protein